MTVPEAAIKVLQDNPNGLSAKMITDSGYDIDELITMVSSKGGTTIAGLEQLRAGNLEQVVENACKACTKRAYELSK